VAPSRSRAHDGLNDYSNNFSGDMHLPDLFNQLPSVPPLPLAQDSNAPLPPIPPVLQQPLSYDMFPRAFLGNLALSQDMIANIRNARLEDDINDPEVLNQLHNPSGEVPELDEQTQISLELFSALAAHPKSAYEEARRVFNKTRPDSPLHSYWVVKSRLEKLSGITQIETDMCLKSCIAFTGPFADLERCPECHESRYDDKKPGKVPFKRFYTIPLGPQIQAQWKTPEGANRMRYRNRKTEAIRAKFNQIPGEPIDVYEDIYDGYQYLEAVRSGLIKEDDTLVLFTLDGAQLYRDKDSDCYFFAWIVLNLSPDLRCKKAYILPGGFVPGPNRPKNVESYLIPSFRHVSAIQREGGLAIWEGQMQEVRTSNLFFAGGNADTVGLTDLSAFVGHQGAHGCRILCPPGGRHKPGMGIYYPVAALPYDCDNHPLRNCINNCKVPDNCRHPDVDISTLTVGNPQQYLADLRLVLESRTKTAFDENRLKTGISRPTICLGFQPDSMYPPPLIFTVDLMHLNGNNLPMHLLNLWRGKVNIVGPKPNFDVLSDEAIWSGHGKLVASMASYFPTSFGRTPRNPKEKINTGYKAIEWVNYFWILGPAIFRLVLPHEHWVHFCKLVSGIRIIHQRKIHASDLQLAHGLLLQWVTEFEEIYCERDLHRIHLVLPCVHTTIHLASETARLGPLGVYAQWALENMIGNLGREVHQHSNPFMNLSERGLLRARINALKALVPDFDLSTIRLPRAACDLGGGYVFLPEKEDWQHNPVEGSKEEIAIQEYLTAINPGPQDFSAFSLERWARLQLPNGQCARSAFKEILRTQPRISRNVKVCNPFISDSTCLIFISSKSMNVFISLRFSTFATFVLWRKNMPLLFYARILNHCQLTSKIPAKPFAFVDTEALTKMLELLMPRQSRAWWACFHFLLNPKNAATQKCLQHSKIVLL
jgi:hypothetical protein